MAQKPYQKPATGAKVEKATSTAEDQAYAATVEVPKPTEGMQKTPVVEEAQSEIKRLKDLLKATREELEKRCAKLAGDVEQVQKEHIKLQAQLKESESARASLQAEVNNLKERDDINEIRLSA